MQTGEGVEKTPSSSQIAKLLGIQDAKKPGKSFVEHPSAILLWSISLAGVFQHPQAIVQVSARKTSLTQGR